jgi:ATP-dependent DNA helicase RecG
MTVYADLDISIIDELPPGRTPVKTVVIPNDKRLQVVERVRQACLEHRQAYWVCTLIEESELLQCQAAEATKEQLIILLGELRIGLVHGRLKAVEKEAIMRQFKANELDLLVATTVIEVGVDVPNASLMVIENAERLGLAQLHQLRGRVGRGATESYCVLLYQAPLSQHAQTRLKVMRATTDGFEIAKQDLEIRGPGEMLGTKQTGLLRFRIADLRRDQVLLKGIPVIADDLLRSHETNALALIQRWLGSGERYGGV